MAYRRYAYKHHEKIMEFALFFTRNDHAAEYVKGEQSAVEQAKAMLRDSSNSVPPPGPTVSILIAQRMFPLTVALFESPWAGSTIVFF